MVRTDIEMQKILQEMRPMPAHAPEKVLQQPLACTTLYLVSAVEVEV